MAPHARIYTEMVEAAGLVAGGGQVQRAALDPAEHPIALQLGGNDPGTVAAAARLGADLGFDEINFNACCPTDRTGAERFGACLMDEPALVADCVAAARAAVGLPVTVKVRIGFNHREDDDVLDSFIDAVTPAGCDTFIVHARKVWLDGLDPAKQRETPPLNYGRVERLKAKRPHLTIIINGGIASPDEAKGMLRIFDGVMVGRAAYAAPRLMAEFDRLLFAPAAPERPLSEIYQCFMGYRDRAIATGAPASRLAELAAMIDACHRESRTTDS